MHHYSDYTGLRDCPDLTGKRNYWGCSDLHSGLIVIVNAYAPKRHALFPWEILLSLKIFVDRPDLLSLYIRHKTGG